MTISYRTRRKLRRITIAVAIVLALAVSAWLCWVVWLQRYVVYTDNGASLDFSLNPQISGGAIPKKPQAKGGVSIYYNEGSDAIETSREMAPLNGYYIDYDMLTKQMDQIPDWLNYLSPGTPVMLELKAGYGSFFYSSKLPDAISSQSVPVARVDELIKTLQSKGFYLIAKVSSFRDYNYGLNHVPSGLYMLSRAGLWADSGGCYWLNPTDSSTMGWITSIAMELKEMGFHEILLADFMFPESNQYIFNGDKDAALSAAADTLYASVGGNDIVLSFGVTSSAFPIPEGGRSRLFVQDVKAAEAADVMAAATMENPESHVVFVCETNDTRFDDYSVLRPLSLAEVVETQKADMAALAAATAE